MNGPIKIIFQGFKSKLWTKNINMHFRILEIHLKNKYPAKFSETGPEPDIEAGYPAGTGYIRSVHKPAVKVTKLLTG